MKMYSALVKDGNRLVVIKNQVLQYKADFIHDLRSNGYMVNPKKVKESILFEYIINQTNCYSWDWDLTFQMKCGIYHITHPGGYEGRKEI